ncbi:MerR family transcriptional regulator [Ohtaekwangia koreensis]|uniref:DNA-binding transcriptional regulator, MerR family n=1 Tax=Ohtaekwangia koreensis TaxID=688867 RepID=A0A1T5MER5_9BACT|nr:MerR family transcriptional regulator [Ohtaekwangia koreensis]SKC86736.1 DNA-binding transcriptional regulator, MerR family [Ohtaekwangia koreensis]
MGKYSIKELEKLSGIKAHTIRIWEKRHKLIQPSRTDTNIRFYSDDDLKKIINVSLLNNNGIKISRIADMTLDEMNRKVLEISEIRNDSSVYIDQLILAMIDMEEEIFEKILGTIILRHGFEKTITEIIYPFLEKIGILWQAHNITPAHEHFISNLIRQKIIVAIDGLPIPAKTARKVVLFLPEGEMHELGLLFYSYLMRMIGYRTYYLGQNVPHDDLISVVKTHQPEILITSVTSPIDPIDQYLQRLTKDFSSIRIFASGMQIARYKGLKVNNIQTFSTALELKAFIQP